MSKKLTEEEAALKMLKERSFEQITNKDIDLILDKGYTLVFREIVKQIVKPGYSVFTNKEKENISNYIKYKFNTADCYGENHQIEISHNKASSTLIKSFTPKELVLVLTYLGIKHTFLDENTGYLLTTQIQGKEPPHEEVDIPEICKVKLNNDALLVWEHSNKIVDTTSGLYPIWAVDDKGNMYINSYDKHRPVHSQLLSYGNKIFLFGYSMQYYGGSMATGGELHAAIGKILPFNKDNISTGVDNGTGHYLSTFHQFIALYKNNKFFRKILENNFKKYVEFKHLHINHKHLPDLTENQLFKDAKKHPYHKIGKGVPIFYHILDCLPDNGKNENDYYFDTLRECLPKGLVVNTDPVFEILDDEFLNNNNDPEIVLARNGTNTINDKYIPEMAVYMELGKLAKFDNHYFSDNNKFHQDLFMKYGKESFADIIEYCFDAQYNDNINYTWKSCIELLLKHHKEVVIEPTDLCNFIIQCSEFKDLENLFIEHSIDALLSYKNNVTSDDFSQKLSDYFYKVLDMTINYNVNSQLIVYNILNKLFNNPNHKKMILPSPEPMLDLFNEAIKNNAINIIDLLLEEFSDAFIDSIDCQLSNKSEHMEVLFNGIMSALRIRNIKYSGCDKGGITKLAKFLVAEMSPKLEANLNMGTRHMEIYKEDYNKKIAASIASMQEDMNDNDSYYYFSDNCQNDDLAGESYSYDGT
ncbi:MAG: hypothetical protein HRU35_00735 [Rickettsiaceae bacterium]|nr:hypothetical protein [Rickettsiaceae bacterium]